ncbi:MAG: abortive infection family protein [Endomicrobia bacterium]|nr:abortive infection family protein [Endomicrobiia bacterium]
MKLRPKYKMKLVAQMHKAIFDEYINYSSVEAYINEFVEELDWDNMGYPVNFNFRIQYTYDKINKTDIIDLTKTLTEMPQDTLFSIAVDIGIQVPMILPAFPTFTRTLTPNETGSSYAREMFDKAYKLVLEDPAQAIGLANSALESIVKHILEDPQVTIKYDKNDTLYKLTGAILKKFKFFPSEELHKNIKNIGSSLLRIASEIEELRSDKTFAHGKGKNDYIVDSSLYSAFILNSIITVGLFIISYYESKYNNQKQEQEEDLEDIPF